MSWGGGRGCPDNRMISILIMIRVEGLDNRRGGAVTTKGIAIIINEVRGWLLVDNRTYFNTN